MHPLQQHTIIVTRPQNQAGPLCDAITALGGHSLSIPSISIQPIAISPSIKQLTVSPSDIAIFVSANAVQHSATFWQQQKKMPQLIAIGPGTAQAMHKHGLAVSAIPSQYSSEGLLKMKQLSNPSGQTIFICCGEKANRLLPQQLQQRGAIIQELVCYRRELALNSLQTIKNIDINQPNIVVTTSLNGLQNWHRLIQRSQRTRLLQQPTLIVNPKHRDFAEKHGIHNLIQSTNASDQAILQALKSYCLSA